MEHSMECITDEELPESHGNHARKISQSASRNAMKASVRAKKEQAARFRRSLKKSNILKIKLWQNTLTRSEEKPRLSPLPSNCLKILPRLSPDITSTTNYRYTTSHNSINNNNVSSNHNQISSSSNSSESSHHHHHHHRHSESEEEEGEEEDEDEEDNEKAHDSDSSEQSSVKSNKTGSLISSNKGDAVVDDVEDYIRSGKPIRAAAVAALEAVHGRSLSEEALQRLRKAYTMKPSLPKGRGRRTIAKRGAARPIRAPQRMPGSITCESLIHRNCYYQIGDIVCIIDNDKPYFLQVQTLLKDWNEGAMASMIWLTPKKGCKRHLLPFNPMNFDLRRDLPFHNAALDEVKHIMHCPLDYFDGHASFWNPRPGMVYVRLGEPLVKFIALEPPKKPETKEEVPKENLDNDNAEATLIQMNQDKEDIEMDLEVEQFSNRNRNVDENLTSSSIPDISNIRSTQRDSSNDNNSNSS